MGEGGLHPARKYQPSTGAVKGSKILWPRPLRTPHNHPPTAPLHGQSILEVLRTKPLTAPAPGSDRRLSGEAQHVGSHPHRSDHGQQASVPELQRRRLGALPRMHLLWQRAHLHVRDLHRLRRQRACPLRARSVGRTRGADGHSRTRPHSRDLETGMSPRGTRRSPKR